MKKLEYTKLSGLLGSASTICCEEAKAVLAEFVEELQD